MWRIVAVDSVTRKVFYDLTNVATASWSSKLNGAGSVDVTVQVRDAITPVPVEVLELLRRRQKATTIIVGWVQSTGTTYAMADALIDQSVWHPDTGVLELSGQSVWALMSERSIYPMTSRDVVKTATDGMRLINYSIEGAVWWVIEATIGAGRDIRNDDTVYYTPTGSPRRHLDVRFQTESSTQVQTWSVPFRERLGMEILDEFLARDGAPDVKIQPRLVDDELFYLVTIGVDLVRWEAELVHERADGFQSRLVDLQVVKDGVKTMTAVLLAGGGSGKSMQTAAVTSTDIGNPLEGLNRERITSAKQADDSAKLRSLAFAELKSFRHDVEQWSFGVQCDDGMAPTWFMPGVNVRLQYGGDELYPAREHLFQVLGVSGSTGSMRLGLEVQGA